MNWSLKEAIQRGREAKAEAGAAPGGTTDGKTGDDGTAAREADDLYNRLFRDGPENVQKGVILDNARGNADGRRSGTGVSDVGAVGNLTLPKDWHQTAARKDSTGYAFTFRPNENDRVALSLLYRGRPLDDCAAETLKSVLDKPVGYQLNAGEIGNLRTLIGDKADGDVFSLSSAKVQDLHGKKVLSVSGSYRDDNVRATSYFVPAGTDDRVVQELAYVAPQDQYLRYWQQADSALRTIKWK
ncbi:MAG: hypothetical protein U0105_05165 [Candidatus Obscuribacterales bacterium]